MLVVSPDVRKTTTLVPVSNVAFADLTFNVCPVDSTAKRVVDVCLVLE